METNKMIKDILEGIRITNGHNALMYIAVKGKVEKILSKIRIPQ